MSAPPLVRAATPADAVAVAALVASAYRGEASRAGWTTEADLLEGERIDAAGVAERIGDPAALVLVVDDGERVGDGGAPGREGLLACCELVRRPAGTAYFGLFAVRPDRQAAGLGRRVLAAAESEAAARWGSRTVEMTVISQRSELIAWYGRRGYAPTGEERPFVPGLHRPGGAPADDLAFVVLAKALP